MRGGGLVRGSLLAFATKIAVAAIAFGFNVLVARLLGIDDAGLFFLGLSVVTVAAVIGRAGLGNPMIRFIATAADSGHWHEVRSIANVGIRFAALCAIVAAALSWWLAPWIATAGFNKPGLVTPLRLLALGIAPLCLTLLYGQLLQGLSRITAHMIVFGGLVPALAGIAAVLLAPRYGLEGVAAGWSGATALSWLIAAFIWHRQPALRDTETSRSSLGEILVSAHPLFWASVAVVLIQWASPMMLGIWGSSADVAQFTAASRTALLTSLLLVAVTSVVTPRFAALYARGDMQQLEALARKSSLLLAVSAAPVCAVLIAAPRFVLSLFGDGFAGGGTALALLAAGQFVNVATGSVQYLLAMCGHEKALRNVTLIAAISIILLNVLLIPRYGLLGAAIAMSVTIAGQNLGVAWMVKQRLGIWPLPAPWK